MAVSYSSVSTNVVKTLSLRLPGPAFPTDGSGKLSWYFPCNLYDQYGASAVNNQLESEPSRLRFIVLDLNLLNWLDRSQVSYPDVFDDLKQSNNQFSGQDITMQLLRAGGQQLGGCLTDIIQVGYIDTNTLGCVASTVVLYASLVVIIGVVLIKWAMAVWFAWFFGWRLGSFGKETAEQRAQRAAAIETWSSDIYRPAPPDIARTHGLPRNLCSQYQSVYRYG
ncbi:Chitin synthase, class 3 [Puccinia graminis f. sp. tritici]|uniref:Chitin synthase, class 3 n=1 Tax=Puccinia graminis f. sp. tritici TaxID=56615 RepID=A0A5B0NFU8_PUCGR|nr:Chitin synthase, class 3 [Puccinia graminis f. sp. tritici]